MARFHQGQMMMMEMKNLIIQGLGQMTTTLLKKINDLIILDQGHMTMEIRRLSHHLQSQNYHLCLCEHRGPFDRA
jgi:hypothetical protein